MAIGLHWEWRGFGAVTSDFIDCFCALERKFPPQDLKDVYLWIPKLEVNAKFRKKGEGHLKFKRIKNKEDNLEQWHENPDEIFEFPLQEVGWDTLTKMLNGVDMTLAPYPMTPPNLEVTTTYLEEARCKTVLARKRREGRLLQGPHGKVIVEWGCIFLPQAILSIGLETWEEDLEGDGLPDEQAKEDILSAIESLKLKEEPLKVMNYMDAVAVWAASEKI
jgi:hypothetical protein